jgi:hypothetical protein
VLTALLLLPAPAFGGALTPTFVVCLCFAACSWAAHCEELTRLQSIYPHSERSHIEAQLSLAQARARYDELTSSQRLRAGAYAQLLSASTHSHSAANSPLHAALHETEQRVSAVRAELDRFHSHALPALLSELAELQITTVLQGDYDLKVSAADSNAPAHN